jgi:hypothetical protein
MANPARPDRLDISESPFDGTFKTSHFKANYPSLGPPPVKEKSDITGRQELISIRVTTCIGLEIPIATESDLSLRAISAWQLLLPHAGAQASRSPLWNL